MSLQLSGRSEGSPFNDSCVAWFGVEPEGEVIVTGGVQKFQTDRPCLYVPPEVLAVLLDDIFPGTVLADDYRLPLLVSRSTRTMHRFSRASGLRSPVRLLRIAWPLK